MEPEENTPGVSGKSDEGKSWINPKELKKQKEFADDMHEIDKGYESQGRGGNLFGRSDLTNQEGHGDKALDQEAIVLALKRSPEVDIAQIEVAVKKGTVLLTGSVDDPARVRTVENIVRNIPGVTDVINQLVPRSGERL